MKSNCCADYTGCSQDPTCGACLAHILDGVPMQDTCYSSPNGPNLFYNCAQDELVCKSACYP